MEAKFSPRVKDVINFSREEALRLGHDYIGTEHLLLGIIREGDGLAIKILKTFIRRLFLSKLMLSEMRMQINS
jgi:ATP-dependent Clp protease ATP-binding subunit ClpC